MRYRLQSVDELPACLCRIGVGLARLAVARRPFTLADMVVSRAAMSTGLRPSIVLGWSLNWWTVANPGPLMTCFNCSRRPDGSDDRLQTAGAPLCLEPP